MLNPRAIALQGIGFSPMATLNMGFFDIEVIVEPIIPAAGSGGGYAERPVEEQVKLTFIVTVRGNKVVKNYVVSKHAGMQLLKHIELTKKAAAKVKANIVVTGFTNMFTKAKEALAKVNISTIRKKP